MYKEKIAILTDSGTDVPKEYIDKYNIFVIPLVINYKDKSYLDGIDISARDVYESLKVEIPKTSLPPIELIKQTFEKIVENGYEKIIAITISSGLSGTNNVINVVAKEYPHIETFVLDTKNIGIGAGFATIAASNLLDKNYSFMEIKDKLLQSIANTKIFFCVETLEYLKKGGRIGLVTCAVGTLLELKPIISCNEDGVYYTVTKCVGRKNSLKKTLEMAQKYASNLKNYNVAIVNGHAETEADEIIKKAKEDFPNMNNLYAGSVSPALVVHTGPGLIGIGIQMIVE